jgi:AcrR family transcriptional regulator
VAINLSPAPARKARADAERNRQRLIETARATFNSQGTSVSLDEIARSAGVGIGTLYRHFPTRDLLIAEVYRNEAAKLSDAAAQLAEDMPPLEALRAWLLLFVDYLATKLILVEALKAMVEGDASRLKASSGEQLTAAITLLFARAIESGDIAADGIDPIDLLRAISGVAMSGAGPGWDIAARRMVDVLIAGLNGDARA